MHLFKAPSDSTWMHRFTLGRGKISWPFISEEALGWNLADHLTSTPPHQSLKIRWSKKEIDIGIEYKNIKEE